MTKNILVTGGLGFIGHNVVKELQDNDYHCVVVDSCTDYGLIPQDELGHLYIERKKRINPNTPIHYVDIANTSGIRDIFDSYNFDIVIHTAAFPRQKVVNANPMAGSRSMSEGLLNLLENSVRTNVSKFVYISSSMVYGDFEDNVKEDASCNPQGQYGIMKLAGEWLVRDYTRKTSGAMSHVIIRPSAVYGPYDVDDRVVSKFMLAAINGNELKVNGATEALDFTFVTDTASGIVGAALSDNANNKTYNITRGESHTLLDAAKLSVDISDNGSIIVGDRDINFPSRGALNIDAARNDFGYDPKVNFREGLKLYYDWLINDKFFRNR